MRLIFILLTSFAIMSCSITLSKEAEQVTFHSQVSALLNDCKRLGTIKIEYTTQPFLSVLENDQQARNEMRQWAYDKYKADNVAYISHKRIEGSMTERPVIYAEGVAFKCGK